MANAAEELVRHEVAGYPPDCHPAQSCAGCRWSWICWNIRRWRERGRILRLSGRVEVAALRAVNMVPEQSADMDHSGPLGQEESKGSDRGGRGLSRPPWSTQPSRWTCSDDEGSCCSLSTGQGSLLEPCRSSRLDSDRPPQQHPFLQDQSPAAP